MSYRSRIVCLAVTFLLIGCSVPGVDDEAQVVVRGRILVAPTEPYGGHAVYLHRSSTWLEAFVELAYLPIYWLDCVLSEVSAPGSCGAWMTDHSEADGAYSFAFTGDETRNEIGQLLDFQVSAVRGSGTDSEIVLIRFDVRQETLEFGDLIFWGHPPMPTSDASQVRLDWADAIVYEGALPDRVDLEFLHDDQSLLPPYTDGDTVWRVDSIEEPFVELDLRIFQDVDISYRASDETVRSQVSTSVRIQRTSPAGQLGPHTLVPASRDATCVYATGLGSRVEQPCALTDGDFGSVFTGDGSTCDYVPDQNGWYVCVEDSFEELTVVLDATVEAPTIFLYEFGDSTSGITLSVSEDGSAFAAVESDLVSFSVHPVSQVVRYIRFRREVAAQESASGGMRSFLSEIGVF